MFFYYNSHLLKIKKGQFGSLEIKVRETDEGGPYFLGDGTSQGEIMNKQEESELFVARVTSSWDSIWFFKVRQSHFNEYNWFIKKNMFSSNKCNLFRILG